MRRFFVPIEGWGEVIRLPAGEAHHAFRVLRLRAGDTAVAFDGRGLEATVRIRALGPEGGEADIVGDIRAMAPGLRVVLGQGMPKGDKLETILQHTTELGVSEVRPLLLARAVARPDAARTAGKLERWQRIVAEAAKQSRRADIPVVMAPGSLEAFCRDFEALGPGRRGVVLYEQAAPQAGLRAVLERWEAPDARGIWLLVGPEGGLEPGEVARAGEAGFVEAGLGPRILRTETAGLAVISILQYLWGASDSA